MTDSRMPSFARLQTRLHTTFAVRNAEGFGAEVEMIDVYEGIAMNARYQCYSAQFALPLGLQLPQAVYAVHDGQDEWPLLLTPVMPGEDGRSRMEAVFHVRSKTVDAGAKPALAEDGGPAGSLVT